MAKQKVLIAGGSGLVGSYTADYLDKLGYEIHILSRSEKKHPRFHFHKWDLQKETLDKSAIKVDHIINLTGAGIADKRWTDQRKKEIIDSRVQSAQLIYNGLKEIDHKPKSYISASAIGIYGNRGDEILTESSEIGTSDFMVECCNLWEAEANNFTELVDHLSILRIGIVISSKGGALSKFVLPIKLGQANYFGKGDHYYSWIHIQDLAKIILSSIEGKTSGIINAVSPTPLTNKEFMRACKKAIEIAMGKMSKVILNSNRVIPQVLMDQGFKFEFSDLAEAVMDVREEKV